MLERGIRKRPSALLILVGPTASGKTAVSMELARLMGGEVISADSMQVYRGMDVGTDKISPEVRREAPHHLVDVVEPTESMDAARWVELAETAIREIHSRGREVIVAGGTGLYIRGLLKGFFSGPSRDDRLRQCLRRLSEASSPAHLHSWVRRLDPKAAEATDPNDLKRTLRALEVIFHTGRPFRAETTEWAGPDRYRNVKFGLHRNRQELHRRIDARVEQMYHRGLLTEVRALLERGAPPGCNAFKAIGYREALGVIQGEWDAQEAIRRTQAASRQYAKRQMTWFRGESDTHWVDASRGPGEVAAEILRRYRERIRDYGQEVKNE